MESKLKAEESNCKALTDQNQIEQYLDGLRKDNKNELFLKCLLIYYPILSPTICQKYNIHKARTEKETLFYILNDLITKFGDRKNNFLNNIKDNDLFNYIENNILNKPAKEELKDLNLDIIESRWDIFYRKIVRIEDEANDELIYYNLTNDILRNVLINQRPFQIIYFFEQFMNIYNNRQIEIENLPKTLKKYVLLGLGNNEHPDNNNFLSNLESILNYNMTKKSEEELKLQFFNIDGLFEKKLLTELIIKYSKSNLAKSAFRKIFQMEKIPPEIESEIFSDNIVKYFCYFPYNSYFDTERTMKRFSLILINNYKDKKLQIIKNPVLNELLKKFTNIVVRKYIFCHEHPHLSGGLLFIHDKIERVGTPPHNITDGNVKYLNNEKKVGERGKIFEELAYGKVFILYSIFDLLFMANEKYDELDIDSHLNEYKKYCESKKDLKSLLEGFPADQILSPLVEQIYQELSMDNNQITYKNLTTKTIAFKKEDDISDEDYYELLSNVENLVTTEVCPLSVSKPPYRIIPNN